MRILVQRCLKSSVSVHNKVVGAIDYGLVAFVGFTTQDTVEDIDYLIDKMLHLRIFDDENGVMNLSLLDVKGSILSISQFTLYADARKGRRPSYSQALKSKEAKALYDIFHERLKQQGVLFESGIFGADMDVSMINHGPVTILLESREKDD